MYLCNVFPRAMDERMNHLWMVIVCVCAGVGIASFPVCGTKLGWVNTEVKCVWP